MFQGYSNETFEFFMAIRFNNNRPFFQDNRDWYLRAVREPSLALAQELAELVEEIEQWCEKNPSGPYTSESFGGYSYTKATNHATGRPVTWQDAFRSALNQWRKL